MAIGHVGCSTATEELWFVKVVTTAHNSDDEWVRAETEKDVNSGTYANAVIDITVTEELNLPRMAEIILTNRAIDFKSSTAGERKGPLTDIFHEGMEILLVNHMTHHISFRGYIQDIRRQYNEMQGSTIELTCYDSLRALKHIPLDALVPHDKDGLFKGDARTIAADEASEQIRLLMETWYKPVAKSSGNERFYHFDFQDRATDIAYNNKHLFALSPAGTVAQGGAEAFKLPGGWIQIGRENLLERITNISQVDPHTASKQADKIGFDFRITPNVLDPGDRTATGLTQRPIHGETGGDIAVTGKWLAYPKDQKMIRTDGAYGTNYRRPALSYNPRGTWPSPSPLNTSLRIIRPVTEGVQVQGRKELGTQILYPQAVMMPDTDWERVGEDIYTSAIINYSIGAEDGEEGGSSMLSATFEAINVWNLKLDTSNSPRRDFAWKQDSGNQLPRHIGAEGISPGNLAPNRKGVVSGNDVNPPTCAEIFYIDTRDDNSSTWVEGYEAAGVIQYTSAASTDAGTGGGNTPVRTDMKTMLISHINHGVYSANASSPTRTFINKSVWPTRNALISNTTGNSTSTHVRIRGHWSGATAYFNAGGGASAAEHTSSWMGRAIDFTQEPKIMRLDMKETDTMAIRRAAVTILTRLAKDTRRGILRMLGGPHYHIDARVQNLSTSGRVRSLIPYDLHTSHGSSAAYSQALWNFGAKVGDAVTFHGAGDQANPSSASNYYKGAEEDYGYIKAWGSAAAKNLDVVTTTSTTAVADWDFMRVYVPLRAGLAVRIQDEINGINGNYLVTKVSYRCNYHQMETVLNVIGEQDDVTLDVMTPQDRSKISDLVNATKSSSTMVGYNNSNPDLRNEYGLVTISMGAGDDDPAG